MRKPNFFIIGAPKCGTSSVFTWLSTHPQIFTPEIKEMNFFSRDIWVPKRISENDYLEAYQEARSTQLRLCDASTRYLYSEEAIDNILDYCEGPKFIAMVRNPIDMVYSLYNHLVFINVEHCNSFREAWLLKDERLNGESIMEGCTDPCSLAYGEIGRLGDQIERFFNKVSPSNRLVIVLDDLESNPGSVYKKVINFLDLEDDMHTDFSVSNRSMVWRSKTLNRAILALARAKSKLGINKSGFGLLNKLSRMNRKDTERDALPVDLLDEMQEFFFEDTLKLGELLRRDLSHWVSR